MQLDSTTSGSSSLSEQEELDTLTTSRDWCLVFFLASRFIGKDDGFISTCREDRGRLRLLLLVVDGTSRLVLVGSLRALLSFHNLYSISHKKQQHCHN